MVDSFDQHNTYTWPNNSLLERLLSRLWNESSKLLHANAILNQVFDPKNRMSLYLELLHWLSLTIHGIPTLDTYQLCTVFEVNRRNLPSSHQLDQSLVKYFSPENQDENYLRAAFLSPV